MNLRSIIAVPIVALAVVACGRQESAPGADGTWVGTITTEGNVTTVVNESGSVWGGTARLVEEVSIGVAAGADEYMFGLISSVYVTKDRIYVVDSQVPAVRAYDHAGTFVGTLGRVGQGPGEYMRPRIVAADTSGRVFVLDGSLGRLNVYAPSGETLESWPLQNSRCCVRPMYPLGDDAIWAPVYGPRDEETGEPSYGVQAVGPSGLYGEVMWVPEIDYARTTYEIGSGFEVGVPFSPSLYWYPAPEGRMVVGASDKYRFEVHGPGGTKLVVERYWEPTPVPAEHKEWERQRRVATQRRNDDPGWNLDGSDIPDHKPAYRALIPALSGETWLARAGVSERLADCAENPIEAGYDATVDRNPCWTDRPIVDAFGAGGRYLGEVQMPPGIRPSVLHLVIDGRLVVAVAQDPQGTYMVKRYRLVLPGDEEP